MKITLKKISLIVTLCISSLCVLWGRSFYYQWKEDVQIEQIIASMDIEDKIGQLIMVGIHSKKIPSSYEAYMRQMKPGGVILFRRALRSQNQVRTLIRHIQELCTPSSGIPLFVAVDQEGGKVNRVRMGFTHLPGNMAISATGSEKYARIAGEINGMELRSLGINVNLAPCVDVLQVATNEVIGTRSFGSEILPVGHFARAYFQGLKKYHVLGCAKHFPNHGAVREDSHRVLPQSDVDKQTILQYLLPYRMLIKNKIDMIMPAHINWLQVGKKNMPGTFSKEIILGLLRQELKYQGVVISDAMEMNAVTGNFSYSEAAVQFIKAGGDIILIGSGFRAAREIKQGILEAVQEGIISEERIKVSLHRILKLKLKIGTSGTDKPQLTYEHLSWEKNRYWAYQIALKSIRRYGAWGRMPVITEDTKVLLISSSGEWKDILHASFSNAEFFKISRYPRINKKTLTLLEKKLIHKKYNLVAFVSENKSQSQWYQYMIERLKNKLPYIMIFSEDLSSLHNPFYEQFPIVVSWGPSEFSRRAALETILLKKT